MSKDRMHQQSARDMAQSHRGGAEGVAPKKAGEKHGEKQTGQRTTKRGSTSKA